MLHKKSKALLAAQWLALVVSLLIAGQIGYILSQGAPLCPNDGCKVVEELTRVSPLFFNLAGLCFFQVIFWGLRSARGEKRHLPRLVKTALLAALAVEAVLIGFQYLVAQAFCAYCVGIFACVVLLNLLLGARQIGTGMAVFAAALLAFASLEFNQAPPGQQAFTAGVFANRPGLLTAPEHYLFYASTCAHCEKVIAALKNIPRATMFFNPIDKVTAIDLPGVTRRPTYAPAANKALLQSLAINEIPVLMTRTPDGWTIRRGEAAILAYLAGPDTNEISGQSGSLPASVLPPELPGMERSDGCQVTTECTSGATGQSPSR